MSLPQISRKPALSAVLFLCLAQFVYATGPTTARVRNFGQVNANLYRGGTPTEEGLEDLSAMGVKLVVDLRESGTKTTAEQTFVEHLGMKYVNIPFAPWSAPDPDKLQAALGLLLVANSSQPVFVHCWRGKDRTGTVVACYRIQHDGWNNRRALEEANQFGMSHTERGMRSFVLHFAPGPLVPVRAVQ